MITRSQGRESPFRRRLEAAGHAVTGRSLVRFEAVSFREVPPADWVFFYSRRGVQYFFEGLEQAGLSLPAGVRLAAIGRGTAQALGRLGRQADFSGEGDPGQAARAFARQAAGQRVLFPRARRSRQSVQQDLDGIIEAVDLVVYDNRPAEAVPTGPFDVLVFTSPLNAQAYFARQPRRAGQRLVAIGRTTAAALQALGMEEVAIAAAPSEEELAEVVLGGG